MADTMDTQNKAWVDDKSKFGFRMMEKMGWTEGKGLGANEDGKTAHVRVRKKATNSGIGAGSAALTAWQVPAQVASGLNDVLARLAAAAPVGKAMAPSVGGASTTCGDGARGRSATGFYGRRIKGKAVGGYSEKDLREIFGGAAIVDSGRPADAIPVVGGLAVATELSNTDINKPTEENKKSMRRLLRKEKRERMEKRRLRKGDGVAVGGVEKKSKQLRQKAKNEKRERMMRKAVRAERRTAKI
jgi:G-patch domain